MKKLLKTGKKTLSVIMAVMMVLSAWVWVAPTEASAATAGNYKVKVWLDIDDSAYSGDQTIYIDYYTNNGTGTAATDSTATFDSFNDGDVTKEVDNIPGFPYQVRVYSTGLNLWGSSVKYGINVYVTNAGGSSYSTLYTESTSAHSHSGTSAFTDTVTIPKSKFPYVNTFPDITVNRDIYLPTIITSGRYSSNTVTVGQAKDQYGVNYIDAETITVSGSVCETTGLTTSKSGSVLTVTGANTAKNENGTSQTATVVAKWKSANTSYDTESEYRSKTYNNAFTIYNPEHRYTYNGNGGTVNVDSAVKYYAETIGDSFPSSGTRVGHTFLGMFANQHTVSYDSNVATSEKLTSSRIVKENKTWYAAWQANLYTISFNYKDAAGTNVTETQNKYYGQTVTAPVPPAIYAIPNTDYDYAFLGWSPEVGTTVTGNATYTANYDDGTKVYADYTEVDKAIAAADAIKANYGTDYELKYTFASRSALNDAINDVVRGLGRTRQGDVDGFAAEINAKIAALEPNKFDVIFLDKDGAILLYEKDVEYKESVAAPDYNENYYDATNHYTFTGWDTDEYTSVVDDLVIQPVFTAEGHTYTTETVTSNCVTKGATKYICSCGYSYIDGESDYGDHVWATEFTTDLEPTCTVAGSKSIHCTLCDAQKDITVIPPLGHQWSSQSVAVEATCGKIGIMAKVCDDCGVCEHTIIDALEHDFEEKVVAPTCTTKGYTEYTCKRDNCGYSYRDNYTDVIAHSYGGWETVSEAHCEVSGVKKRVCEDCGFTELDSIDALEHDTPDWVVVVPATCEGEGYRTKTCSKCNNVIASEVTNALTHNYVTKTVVAPTCESKGYTVEECNRADCGAQRIVDEKPALNHAWTSTTHDADCTHSAYIEHVCANDASHNYVEYVAGSTVALHTWTKTDEKAADCTTDGYINYECSVCDATKEEILPKLGHSYSDWVKTDATNDIDGSWYHKCSTCGKEETLTIPKGGHNLVEDKTQYIAPKCNAKGRQVYKCTNHADCSVTVTVELDYAQHTVAQRETPATCTTQGSVEAYCSVCNTSFSTMPTPVVPHTFDNGTATAATCTTSGYTTYTCTANDCDFSYKVYDETKPATGHISWTETGREDATCTEDGSVSYKCDKCTETKTEILPKTGHSFAEDTAAATDATCAVLATKTYKCACGESYTIYVGTTNNAHDWNDWVTVEAATNASLGYKTRTCKVCGQLEVEKIPATGAHNFTIKIDAESKAPTCTEDGYDMLQCSAHDNCPEKSSVPVAKLGHTTSVAYTAPTCIAEGSSKIICETCGETLATETIPVIGYHNFSGEGVKADATCTITGTMTYTCLTDGCNATKVETIPAKGHSFTTTVEDSTCGEKGSVVTECKVCNDPTVKTTYELAAKNHNWNDGEIKDGDAATCEDAGVKTYTCTLCGATKTEEIPATGHTWGEWTVTPSTNDAPGSVSRECAICHEVESVEIPAGGHNLVVDAEASTDATCTNEGELVYKCDKHPDCGITVTVTTAKTQHTVAQREIQATCDEEGKVEAYCSVCNNVLSTEVIPVKAHSYVAQTAVDPTCTTSGYTVYACACGDTYNEYDPDEKATGHSLVEGASTASCTEGGQMTLTCACGYSTTVEVPALGHNYVENTTVATEATCATPATKTFECTHNNCDDSYTVFTGGKTTEHVWGGWVVKENATATSLGYQTAECTVCGQLKVETIPATGEHNFNDETSRTPATCTEDGSVTYKCSTHTDCGLTSTVTLPKLGHTEALEYIPATCETKGSAKLVCSVETCKAELDIKEIPELGHLYGDGEVINATCKVEGSIAYKCTRTDCNDTKTVVIPTNSNAHQYETTVADATCYEKGSVVTKCSLCGKEAFKKELPKIEHTWNDGEIKDGDAATCEADGTKTYTCTLCGATKTETVAKLGHDWNAWVKVDATNDTDGSWTRTCKNDANHVETVVIPKGNHKLVVKSKADATCTKEGVIVYGCETHADCSVTVTVTTAKLQHTLETNEVEKVTCDANGKVVTSCTSCKAELVTTIIPATGHSYSSVITEAATCTKEGVRTFTCAHDASHTYTESIAKLQHVYAQESNTAPTCTENGYTTFKCNTCDSRYVVITASAKGHSSTEKVSSTADCLNSGKLTLKCACGETMETDVPALGHNYTKVSTTPATCATPATETYKCSRCTVSYTVFVGNKTDDHNFGAETVVEATNTSLGYKTRTCETCGQVYFEIIPATGEHNFNIETADKLEPTCTADGYIVYSCSAHTGADACNLTSKVTVPATGHKEKLHYTPATCETGGETKIVCDTCGNTISDVTTISALGHAWVQEAVAPATCNAKGSVAYSCSRCTATNSVEIDTVATAHKLKVETVLSTCEAEGSVTVTCENGCGYKEVTTLLRLQHNWGEWVKTDATNTTDGEWKRICNNNSEHVETVTIPAGGHVFNTSAPASTITATCEQQGTATYNCTAHQNCGVTITVNTGFAEHTYKTDVVESCSTAGSVRTYCTVCDKTFASIALGKAQHEFGVLNTTDPTCTSSGYTTYKCENCNVTYNEIGDNATGHQLVITPAGATCTTGGKVIVTCESCDLYQETDDPALGHSYAKVSETPADCAVAATETYKCSRCDASYTISVGNKTEDHAWNEWEVVEKATYTSLGYQIRTCKICGKLEVETIPATGDHNFNALVSEKIPDCENAGEKVYACSTHTDCGLTSVVTVPATGHKEKLDYKAATCTEEGYTKIVCEAENCTYEKDATTIPELGHAYGEGVVTPSTCEDEGEIEYTCERCFDVKTVVISTNENAHQYEPVIVDATCTSEGSVYARCKLCGDETEKEALPKLEHAWGEPAVTNATCTDDGKKVYTCACGETKTETIAKLGHNMKAGTAVAPTCTTSGFTPYTCENNCGHSYKVYDATVKEHDYVQVEDSSTADCTEGGTVTLKCDACGDVITAKVPALGHDWGEWSTTKNPTAEEDGIRERSCKRDGCNATESVTLPKLGHEMVKDEAASEAPSCTDEGEDVYICNTHADCGYTYTVKVAATGHSYDSGVETTASTCTTDGEKTYTCNCGDKITEAIPATGHTLTTTVNEATCEAEGSVVTKCTVDGCDYSETTALDVKPHTISVAYAYPGCDKAGYVKETCDVCDYEKIVSETEALGHSFTGAENIITDATCYAVGSKTVKCSRCDEVKTVEIPKLSHEFETIETHAATCTESGYIVKDCKNCDETYNEFVSDPSGHDWNDGEITTPATCTENGVITYTCENEGCTATRTEPVAKLGHDWDDWKVTLNPTATVPGIQSRTCKICGATENATIPALGGTTTYTVTFVADGKTVAAQTVIHNGKATAPEVSKASDANYHYSYIWDVDFSRITSDLTVTAIFTPVAHAYGEWVIDDAADCNNEGLRHRDCACGYTQYETIEKTEHSFIVLDGGVDPTCTENGFEKVKCEICGHSEDRTLKRLGHVMTYHEAVDPTCDTDGVAGHYSCSRCGKNFKDRTGKTEITDVVVSKTYHTFLVVVGSEATCTKDGKTDYMYCTACGYTRHPETIPATGHADSNNDNTCDKCGSTYMQGGAMVCSCSCHKNGFFNELIYKILSFFWRLFGINKSCECGTVHY